MKLFVYLSDTLVGTLSLPEGESRWRFSFTEAGRSESTPRLSLSLDDQDKSPIMTKFAGSPHPYFENLFPEGWLFEVAATVRPDLIKNKASRLVELCRDNIGAVEIHEAPKEENYKAPSPIQITTSITSDVSDGLSSFCRICLRPLQKRGHNNGFHENCSLQFFGRKEAPGSLHLDTERLLSLAKEQISQKHSLAGVQQKLSGVFRDKRTTMVFPGMFILKPEPDKEEYLGMARAEAASMKFAQSFGLPVAEVTILPMTNGRPVFIARRFDRTPDGKKIHTEDLAQATGLPPTSKYLGSIEQIVKTVFAKERKTAPSTEKDRKNFLYVTLFNYLIGNPGNHFKNFSVTHGVEDGKRSLSLTPFYDLFPAKVYAKNDNEETGITLLGRKTGFNLEDFRDLEERLGMPRGSADEFVASFEKKWLSL